LSHEIRPPLQAVLALGGVLRGHSPDDGMRRYLELFEQAGDHILALLEHAGRSDVWGELAGTQAIRVDRAVESAVELMRAQAERKGLSLHVVLQSEVSGWRYGNSLLLRQLVVNLVSNAIKFTAQGEISVQLSASDADRVLLEVTDSGDGLPEGEWSRWSAPDGCEPLSSGASGRGMGLSICRQLVEDMSGRMWAVNPAQGGCRMCCELLLPEKPAGLSAGCVASSSETADGLAGARVLVVDDSPVAGLALEALLRESGYRAEWVSDGCVALERLDQESFAVVFMDVRMPVMDGASTVRHIRKRELARGERRRLLVALTGTAEAGIAEMYRVGCDVVLRKPVTVNQLVSLLGRPAAP